MTDFKLIFACPYCEKENSEEINSCCGENHCLWVWVNKNGSFLNDQDQSLLNRVQELKHRSNWTSMEIMEIAEKLSAVKGSKLLYALV